MSELQWARGIGDEWSLAVEVPGVRKLHPVSDLVACLRANPEALTAEQWAEVLSALKPETQDGITETLVAGGVTWGRRNVSAHADGMKTRAEKAERALADLRKLIHEQSGLDDHRYSPEQMVTEMAQRWRGASDDCEKAERERDAARDRAERLEVQLAGCGSAALGYAGPECKPGDYGYSASYGDVLTLRSRIAKLEAAVTAVSEWREMGAYLLPFVVRALDEQDSGGPATVEVPVTTEPRGDGTREDAPSAGQAGSSPLRTLEPDALAEALKTAKLDLELRKWVRKTIGGGA